MSSINTALRWLFTDRRSGSIVVVQPPNPPLWLFLAAYAVRAILNPTGTTGRIVDLAGTAGLAIWAADEVARGVAPWRRLLGGGVLVAMLIARLR